MINLKDACYYFVKCRRCEDVTAYEYNVTILCVTSSKWKKDLMELVTSIVGGMSE